jgi:hypothetical protein
MYVDSNAGSATQFIVNKGSFAGQTSLNFLVVEAAEPNNPNKIRVYIDNSGGDVIDVYTGVLDLSPGWHLFGVEHDGATDVTRILWDGVQAGSVTAAFGGMQSTSDLFFGGRNDGGGTVSMNVNRNFAGRLADVAKWNRTLSAQEWADLAGTASGVRARDLSGRAFLYEFEVDGSEYGNGSLPAAQVVGASFVAGPFAPQNTAPTVTITHPSASALSVPAGTKLVFTATAMDVESGSLSNSIAWSSSNPADGTGGALGTAGGSVTVDTTGWANGQRTITANVTDAGGLPATPDSFTLAIGAGSTLILEDDVQQEILQSGTAATVRVALRDSTGAVLESNPLAPGDVKKSVDGGAAAVLAGDAGAAAWTVVNGFLNVPLTAAEVTGSEITLFIEDQDGSAYLDRAVKIMVVGYDPRATPASTTQIAGAVGDALSARLAS